MRFGKAGEHQKIAEKEETKNVILQLPSIKSHQALTYEYIT